MNCIATLIQFSSLMYVFVFYGKANPSFTEVLCFYPTKLAKLLVICEIMVFICQHAKI